MGSACAHFRPTGCGRFSILVAIALIVAGQLTIVRGQGNVSFDRLVALGDGQTAGFQDGALREASQSRSWVKLLAESAEADFELPLIGDPGLPAPSSITGLGLLLQRPGTCEYGEFDTATGVSPGRLDPERAPANLAVPYHRIGDALDRRWNIEPGNPNDPDTFEDYILGIPAASLGSPPRSQVETAVSLNPTFVAVWLGPMDLLLPALAGEVEAGTLPTGPAFEQRLVEVLARLSAAGAEGVVLNIPEVTSTALVVSAKELKRRTGLSNKQLRNRLGVEKSSSVLVTSLPTIDAIVRGQAAGPLDTSQILDKQELRRLGDAVAAWNEAIERRARLIGWAHVDLHALFDRYRRRGVRIDGVGVFNTGYLGGLYGLDGFHLSNTGQALVAAAAVDAINVHYGTSLQQPPVAATAMTDPHTCAIER